MNLFIGDPNTKTFLLRKGISCSDNTFLVSNEEFSKFNFNDNKYSAIVILVELKWNNCSRQDFYGIEIAKKLRRKELRQPIIFTSILRPETILNKNANSGIITTVGTCFINLFDISKNAINKISEETSDLNDLQMIDVLHNFCNKKGIVGEIFHRLKGIVRNNKENYVNIKPVIIAGLYKIKNLLMFNNHASNKIDEIIIEVRNSGSPDDFTKYEQGAFINFIEDDEDNENRNNVEHIAEEIPWSILILEDQQDEINLLKEKLKENGLTNIKEATSVEKAKEIIEQDKYNNIVVAIADFRLFDTNNDIKNKQQNEQGYDFLKWLSEQDKYCSMIALSGLSRKFLQSIFRNNGIKVSVYSKNDIDNLGGINLFVNEIIEKGNNEFNTICTIPTGSGWDKGYEYWYRKIRKTPEMDSIFSKIDKESTIMIRRAEYFWDYKKTHKNSALCKSLRYNIKLTTGSDYNNFPKVSDFLNIDKKYKNQLNNFVNKLIMRRFGMYFHINYGLSLENVEIFIGKPSKIFNNNYGLAQRDIPSSVLPEEMQWLQSVIDKSKLENQFNNTVHYFQCFLENWFSKYPKHLENLKKEESYLAEYFDENADRKYPQISIIKEGYKHFELMININDVNKKELLFSLKMMVNAIKINPFCKDDYSIVNILYNDLKNKIND